MQLSNWLPIDFLSTSAKLPSEQFNCRYGDTDFLLIRLRDNQPRLITGLAATSTLDPVPLTLDSDELGTEVGSTFIEEGHITSIEDGRDPRRMADRILKHWGAERCFLVALRARQGDPGGGALSVGRSPANDVVLRDPTISKHHAWLVRDDQRQLRLCDLGSKNGTQLNGRRLDNRDVALKTGDAVTFGNIETTLCDARVLWRVLRTSFPPTPKL